MGSEALDYPWYALTSGPALEQGDLLPNTPRFIVPPGPLAEGVSVSVSAELVHAIVVSQSCDLVARKIDDVAFCPIYERSELPDQKPETWNRFRRGEYYRYHLLNRCEIEGLRRDFTIVDLARVFTLPLEFATEHARSQGRRLRLQPPYREHLAQSFARFYMRIGLPIDIPAFK